MNYYNYEKTTMKIALKTFSAKKMCNLGFILLQALVRTKTNLSLWNITASGPGNYLKQENHSRTIIISFAESLYVETNEPSLENRRIKLGMQYATKLKAYPSNPTYDCVFNSLYEGLYLATWYTMVGLNRKRYIRNPILIESTIYINLIKPCYPHPSRYWTIEGLSFKSYIRLCFQFFIWKIYGLNV
jgi:hypothetical protein